MTTLSSGRGGICRRAPRCAARDLRQRGHAAARRTGWPPGPGTVKLRLLGVNDFHGHLEGPRPDIGGAPWLKAHLDRATLPGRTIRVHAGDMIGATPLLSSWFHDEPTMEAGNELGFDVGTLGNHEFDEGGDELIRHAPGRAADRSEGLQARRRRPAREHVLARLPRGAATRTSRRTRSTARASSGSRPSS